ncbi:DUF2867 domain-containing protein [uncultured Croceitalea sp.]|uniref:DUF2867 domain-containing protein n=1 Tax=uncultured Croceitalea sp. TaxID=1798908 RepID=UPI00330671FC
MKITKTVLPKESVLYTDTRQYDYTDSFSGQIEDPNNTLTSTEVGKAFFNSGPKWIGKLFGLRNRIVSIFGLKTSGNSKDRQAQLDDFSCEEGEQLGLFKVFRKTQHEVVLGEDDKHLNFKVSLYLGEGTSAATERNLTISTVVKFNNWFGKLYFLPVKPFHKLIVPQMLKGIVKEIQQQRTSSQ